MYPPPTRYNKKRPFATHFGYVPKWDRDQKYQPPPEPSRTNPMRSGNVLGRHVTLEEHDAWMASLFPGSTRIGRGEFGTAYSVAVRGRAVGAMDDLFARVKDRIGTSLPAEGATVVVKVISGSSGKSWRKSMEDGLRDAKVLAALDREPPFQLCPGVTVRPQDIAPRFYFGGVLLDHGLVVSVMGMASGNNLRKREKSTSALTAAAVEKAFLALHAFGVVHADAHDENVMMVDEGRAVLIDFGLAVQLPEALKRRAQATLRDAYATLVRTGTWPTARVLDDWHAESGIGSYVENRVRKHVYDDEPGRRSFYNPNMHSIQVIMNRVVNPEELDRARLRVWGTCRATGTSGSARRAIGTPVRRPQQMRHVMGATPPRWAYGRLRRRSWLWRLLFARGA